MKTTRKTFKIIVLLTSLIVGFVLSSMTAVYANAESSRTDGDVSKKSESILLHDYNYPGIDKVESDNGLLYTYTIDEQTFSSEISEDDAWRKAIFWQYEQGLKTIEEIEFEYALYTSRGLLYIPAEESELHNSISSVFNGEITGRLMWQPDNGAAFLPLRNMRVVLYAKNVDGSVNPSRPNKLEESKTDANGNFRFTNTANFWDVLNFSGMILGIDVYILVFPENNTFKVSNDAQSIINFSGNALLNWQIINNWLDELVSYSIMSQSMHVSYWNRTGDFGTIQIPYVDMPNNINDVTEIIKIRRAFIVAQGLVMAQNFINECGVYPTHKVYVAYPAFMGTEMDTNAFCYTDYDMDTGIMCIGRFRDGWDTMLHEYGHFVQGSLNLFPFSWTNYVPFFINTNWGINPNHTGIEDHIVDKGKNNGTKFAWSEAFAEAFAMVVQHHYWTGYFVTDQTLLQVGIQGTSDLTDASNYRRFWNKTDSGDAQYSIDKVDRLYRSIDNNSCEGQEEAIITFLWNLFREPFFNASAFWATCTTAGTLTFSAYVEILSAQYSAHFGQITQIMERCQLAPGGALITNTSNINFNTAPTISWFVNGSQKTKLGCVRIAFHDESGVFKYETDNIAISEAYNTTKTYPLGIDDWHRALNSFANLDSAFTMRILVKGYNSSSPVTGPYMSGGQTHTINFPRLVFSPINESEYSAAGLCNKQSTGSIEIPSTYLGKPVTQIGNGAFQNSQLSQIAIPASIISIGWNAFPQNIHVVMLNGRTQIQLNLFSNQKQLSQISIPASVKEIKSSAFFWCENLQTVIFLGTPSLQVINSSAFYGCKSLSQISIPASVKEINSSAFSGCENLQTVTFLGTPSLQVINSSVFSGCKSLSQISIPASVKEINSSAFSGCENLQTVTFLGTPSLQTIGASAFVGCLKLSQVTIPESFQMPDYIIFDEATRVDWQDKYSFKGSQFWGILGKQTVFNMPSQIAGREITSIAPNAFVNQSQLAQIIIPSSVLIPTVITFHQTTRVDWQDKYSFKGSQFLGILGKQTVFNIPSQIAGREITSIAPNAFANQSQLRQIVIPNSVVNIGNQAFYQCNRLESITIPKSVKDIGAYAFSGCINMKAVEFESNSQLQTIKDYSFYNCNSLTNITIPKGVKDIGVYAFYGCTKIKTVEFESDSQLQAIKDYTFYNCNSLTNITIPKSVKDIGAYAFSGCINMKAVEFESGIQLQTIKDYSFYNCNSLTNITIPKSVTDINIYAFVDCDDLVSIIVESGNPVYRSEGNCLIRKNDNTLVIGCKASVIPNSVINIGEYAFYNCRVLLGITIPQNVTNIEEGAFYRCIALKNVEFEAGSRLLIIGDFAFSYCQSLADIYLPEGIKIIGNYAFSECRGLASINLPDSVTSIGASAFYFCNGMTSINIPSNVEYIGTWAFVLCNRLTIYIESTNQVNRVYENEWNIHCPVVWLEEGTFTITYRDVGDKVFSGTHSEGYPVIHTYGTVTILGSATKYGDEFDGWFKDSNGAGTAITSINETEYDSNIILYAKWSSNTSFINVIANGVDELSTTTQLELVFDKDPTSAFTINNITIIGATKGVLSGTGTTRTLTIKDIEVNNGETISIILTNPNGVNFTGNAKKTVIVYKAGLQYKLINVGSSNAGYEVSKGLENVKGNVVIPSSYKGIPVIKIASSAFYGCEQITGISIPDSIQSIGDAAFYNCTSLRNIYIPVNTVSIGNYAFYNCTSLIGFDVDQANTVFSSIDGVLFNKSQTTLLLYLNGRSGSYTVPQGVTAISDMAFYGCNLLSEIYFTDIVTYIGERAFSNCGGLNNVYFPGDITYIGNWAFNRCENLNSVYFSGNVEHIGNWAFYRCENLNELYFAEGVAYIGDWAFYQCLNLVDVNIPGSVSYIGISAFANCYSLETITLHEVTHIAANAFVNCINIDEIFIFAGELEYIGNGAFQGWTSGQTIYIAGLSATPESWNPTWSAGCNANIAWIV